MNKIIDMNKLCSGCLSYEEHKKDPDRCTKCPGYVEKDIDCPCISCLIKVMCDFPCDMLNEKDWIKIYKRK